MNNLSIVRLNGESPTDVAMLARLVHDDIERESGECVARLACGPADTMSVQKRRQMMLGAKGVFALSNGSRLFAAQTLNDWNDDDHKEFFFRRQTNASKLRLNTYIGEGVDTESLAKLTRSSMQYAERCPELSFDGVMAITTEHNVPVLSPVLAGHDLDPNPVRYANTIRGLAAVPTALFASRSLVVAQRSVLDRLIHSL